MNRWIRNRSGLVIPNREAGFIQPGIGLLNKKKSSGGGDPYWANVVSLIHGSGTDGSITITDSAGLTTWTANGGAEISSGQAKFGTTSLYLSTNGYVFANTMSAVDLVNNDFTIEAFIYLPASTGNQTFYLSSSAPNNMILRAMVSNSTLYLQYNQNATSCSGGTVTAGAWHFIAFVRSGTTCTIFLDGVQTASGTVGTLGASAYRIGLGYNIQNNSWWFNGYVAEYRVTKGIARYTSNFTPPTSPFPNHA